MIKSTNETLHQYLVKEARNRGLSMRQMALKMDLKETTLNRIKSIKTRPTPMTYYKIAKYLKVDIEELYQLEVN